MFKLSPIVKTQIKRFISIKRGFISLIIFTAIVLFSFCSEIFINSKALIVSYKNKIYIPILTSNIPGTTFDMGYNYETNYKELKLKIAAEKTGWIIMPLVPYNPYENDLIIGMPPPNPPSVARMHLLGTDRSGRDVLARLVYGFRTSFIFSLILVIFEYAVGVTLGCLMGYIGGKFDLIMQRLIEIWTNIPFLYVVMIVSSIITPTLITLIMILVFFSWTSITWIMRTLTYKEKARDYVAASISMGGRTLHIIFRHIIPNSMSVIITFIPFSFAGGIISLVSLDYLGFGLRPPEPSWGELLNQGWRNLSDYWIGLSVITGIVVTLTLITFIGEAVREAYDPKKYTIYE